MANKTRWLKNGLVIGVLLLAIAAVVLVALAWVAMGTGPDEARAARMHSSPNSADGVFTNPQPLWNDFWGSISASLEMSEFAVPNEPIPVVENTEMLLGVPYDGARLTWLGHSTVLIEIAGKKILTDPVFGESTSPIPALGPQRWYPPPVSLDSLDDVDIVLISHDHYDHLDYPTIVKMAEWDCLFLVPLGVGAHLEYWGVPADKITELDWWDEYESGLLRIAATPARHASGRHLLDQNRTLWAGYAIIGPKNRIMFSGDTGLFDDMKAIGEKYGPFDIVMIEVGAYHRAWPDWHIGPEQAIKAHKWMNGEVFMPIHWGLFNLAMHGWTEPVERAMVAAKAGGVRITVPKPGHPFQVDAAPVPIKWWPKVPWQTASDHPIVSTRDGNPDNRYD